MTQSKNVGNAENTESSNDLSAVLTRMSALSLTSDESRALAVTLNMLANSMSMSSQSNQASASTSAQAAPDAVAMEPPFATAIRSPSPPRYHMPPIGSSGPFYVVTRGRQVGVFTNWTATVAPLVLRVPGAVFESVHSRRLAREMFEEALDDGVVEIVDHTTRRPSRRR
ncbi:hypothetical protein EYR40_008252 [Pleurotus pulmonarius]|nr:hypothetical protein EYR36_009074 [Pleurotus pulmonarius]KAF4597785.1 hypothetical protein EYR40_008252 [Pleurotus pulmonarius]